MTTSIGFDIFAKDRASDTFNKVGGAADNSTTKLQKLGKVAKVAGLGLAAGAALAGKALFDMTRNAVADDAAQRKLAIGIQNATGATDKQVASVEKWIGKQGKVLGITDDELRPAFQRLVEATGSVDRAQRQMSIAMDVSAGTGKSLKTVSEALMKANNGTTASLSKLGLKTKDAQGNTLSLKQALKEMSDTFEGQASAKANTLEGKMDRLKIIFDETKETIGAKLIPVLTDAGDWILGTGVPAVESFVKEWKKGVGTGGQVADMFGTVKSAVVGATGFLMEHKNVAIGLIGAFVTFKAVQLAVAAGTAIYTTVTKVASAATKIWAAGQWLLNAALTANPIGLVVVAIAGLVAGLVIAYKKSETFRDIVDGALRAVGKAGTWLWENALKPAFDGIKKAFEVVGDAGRWLWNNALQPVFKFIAEGVGFIMDGWSKMLSALGEVPGFGWAKDAAKAMAGAADKARAVAAGIKDIPENKNVTVSVAYKYTGLRNGGGGSTRGRDDEFDPTSRSRSAGMPTAFKGGPLADTAASMERDGKRAGKALDKLRADFDRAKDKLKALRGQKSDFASGFSSFSGNVFSQTGADGAPQTAAGMIAWQGAQAAKAKQLAADVKNLVGRGLSKSLIQQLAQSGEEGMAQIRALAMGSQAEIDELNSLNKQTAESLHEAGMAAGGALFDEKITKATEHIAELQSKGGDKLTEALKDLRLEAHIHLDGKTIIQSVKAHNKKRGKASNDFD